MNLGPTETQKMLIESAREFLEKECSTSIIRDIEVTQTRFSDALWQKIAELGWFGLWVSEDHGGLGLEFTDLALVIEEAGRFLLPGPVVETAALLPALLKAAKRDDLEAQYLPGVASGSLVVTLAATEQDASWHPRLTKTTATKSGDSWVINGSKAWVQYAQSANLFIVLASTGSGDDDFGLFLVDGKASGVTVEPMANMTGYDLAEVHFNNVSVEAAQSITGDESAAKVWDEGFNIAVVLLSAYMVGGSSRALEMTTKYAKDRVAFGRPIGAFQAIQHKLVAMLNDTDAAKWATYEAIWKIDAGGTGISYSASLAKYLASEGYRRVCFEGHEVHAGVGFMYDYDLQLYYRRAKWVEQYLGHTTYHSDRMADLLGLIAA